MKKDIILSGVGGQGILSIAAVIGQAALKDGLYMKQAEVHGMSQRGGDVQSNLRISDRPIASDLIPTGKCDLIISLEPMEALRYLPYLSKDGWLVTNAAPFVNIPNYPAEEAIQAEIDNLPHHIMLDVNQTAKEIGNSRFLGHQLRKNTRQHPPHLPTQRRKHCSHEPASTGSRKSHRRENVITNNN